MDLGLKDRVYIVTGGSRGLGHAAAAELVADGAKVVVTGRDERRTAEAAAALGTGAVAVAADNADPATPGRLIAAAHAHFGGLHGVLISVGGPPPGSPTGNTDDQWRAAFDSVFLGAVRLARAVAAEITAQADGADRAGSMGGDTAGEGDRGVIGFVLSGSVYEPISGLAISNALRPGLAGFAKSLADELGPRGVRVVGLLPGRIDTDRVRELDGSAADPAAARAAGESRIPLARYGTPREFGRTAAFVLSPAASYLSGVMLPVDGGARRAF
jgi:3-oxoacyl-[acyl-carrier protein] reductase